MGFRSRFIGVAKILGTAAFDAIEKATAPEKSDGADTANDEGDGGDPSGNDGGSENSFDTEVSDEDKAAAISGSGGDMPMSPLAVVHGTDIPQAGLKKVPQAPQEIEMARGDPQSLFWDPYSVIDALGYKEKPSPMTYATIKAMTFKMVPVQDAILTRIAQVTTFSQPQVDKFLPGYRVRLRDLKEKPTGASEARSQQLEQWIATTGTTEHPESRDSFETFLAKITRDSLTYDAGPFEVVPSKKGKPANFYAVDGSTIRLADTTKIFVDPESEEVIRYVQIYDGLVVAEYTGKQLAYIVRNPSADIRLQGYGTSEMEMLANVVTAFLWGFDYNQAFFRQGAAVKGILNFQGNVPESRLRAFRRHWYTMISGVENAFRTPIMASEGLQFVNMQMANKDMEFSQWFDFLIKLTASTYLMDPMEIGFKYGNEGQKAMFESSSTAKLTASKDKGLKPLLRAIQSKINSHLITPLDPDFFFEFVGIEAATPSEQADLNTKLVKTTRTVDELRALEDLPPLPNGMGALILDPTFMQHMTQSAQSASGTGGFAPPAPPPDPDDPFGKLQGELDNGDTAPEPGGDGGEKPAGPAKPPAFGKSLRKAISGKPDASFTIDIDL